MTLLCQMVLQSHGLNMQLLLSKTKSYLTTLINKPKTISDLGITKDQSSRYQALAAVPDAEFESALGSGAKPSTTAIAKAAKPQPAKPAELIKIMSRAAT